MMGRADSCESESSPLFSFGSSAFGRPSQDDHFKYEEEDASQAPATDRHENAVHQVHTLILVATLPFAN